MTSPDKAPSPGRIRTGAERQGPAADLVRAARELLRWNQAILAERAGVSITTVRRFEAGLGARADTLSILVAALEGAGVVFIEDLEVAGRVVTHGVAVVPDAAKLDRPPRIDAGRRRGPAAKPPNEN